MLVESSDKTKLFYLVVLSLAGSFILGFAAVIPELIAPGFSSHINYLRISILLQDIFVLSLPAYLVFRWSYAKPVQQLGFVKHKLIGNWLFYTLLLFLVSSPAISVLAQWNEQLVFPESLKKIEVWFRQMEDAALQVTDRFLNGTTYFELLLNVIVVAAFAALAEEIFFRGALQQLLKGWFKNGHFAVWIAAFVFSAIHLQFYGFIPRLLMGAVLGYLFLFTGNIWVPVFYHFVNNASVVISKFYWSDTKLFEQMQDLDLNWKSYLVMVLSLIFTIYLLKRLKQLSKTTIPRKRMEGEQLSDN